MPHLHPPPDPPPLGLALPGLAGLLACAEPLPPVDACAELADQAPATRGAPPTGLIYEVYVRSFQDSDGDGMGDLPGLTSRLSHLEALGVETLWLMPMMPAAGPAGYDPLAWDRLTPDYGTEADFDHLLDEAAARGIQVVLDLPLNQVGRGHPWFAHAEGDPESPLRDAFVFSHAQWDELRWFPAAEGGWYYAFFGEGLPDLDWTSPLVWTALPQAMRGWIDRGVVGFRTDAVRQLVEDDGLISDTEAGHCTLSWLYGSMQVAGAELTLAEAWSAELDEVLPYLGEDDAPQADLVLGVPRHLAIFEAFGTGDGEDLRTLLREEQAAGVSDRMASYAGNHDVPRLRDRVPDAAVRRAWMALDFLLPGPPVLYYGDEIELRGTANTNPQDLPWRAPMAWTPEAWGGFTTGWPWLPPADDYTLGVNVLDQHEDPWSMLHLVMALSALRRASPAVREGELSLLDVVDPGVLAFERRDGEQRVLTLVNLGWDPAPDLIVRGYADIELFDLTLEGRPVVDLDQAGLYLDAGGYRILATEDLRDQLVPGPLPR